MHKIYVVTNSNMKVGMQQTDAEANMETQHSNKKDLDKVE